MLNEINTKEPVIANQTIIEGWAGDFAASLNEIRANGLQLARLESFLSKAALAAEANILLLASSLHQEQNPYTSFYSGRLPPGPDHGGDAHEEQHLQGQPGYPSSDPYDNTTPNDNYRPNRPF